MYYEDVIKVMEYIKVTSRDKIQTTKYAVIMGLTTYSVKLYSEIVQHKLYSTVSGRIIFRTITEAYINLKYLMLKEDVRADVYDMFQNYGIGKYKLVMAKLREGKYPKKELAHFDSVILEAYVNELKDESFQEISLGFFDKDSIKKKFELVNEQELYEIYYEYDTNYSHAFWGAIRESSMLLCDNPSHLYHSVPDFTLEQDLKDISCDCVIVLKKMLQLLSSYIELPEFYIEKYGDES